MHINLISQAIGPIHNILQRISDSPMESVGIQPERLTCYYSVEREREPKFLEAVRRLLAVEQTFELRSALCVFVSREVSLVDDDVLQYGQWQIQFQVNDYGRTDDEVAKSVNTQIDALHFEVESFLYD